ncbi:HNH endonuclease signature motif containing protein [Oceanimonas sp. CHS3-5]|uniref:HNH endonuclease n=1 Tax=Oceanimonas sp. CHS3-5 TaxID=3068186 RepID=UPI00273D9FB8|nr:HNH endonuclease signature motif containing protein [Oceanimonas sp. CHS3-5]MDP5291869.1 HNH endonuclease signature motif containing protein [Oceanimonas sp. CHS3-5]
MKPDDIVEQLLATGLWGEPDASMGLAADFRCQYCGKDLLASVDNYKEWQTDHLVPSSSGGLDEISNYVICCRTCNFIKGRWNPQSEYVGVIPTREQLIISAKKYISEKRHENESVVHELRKIVGRI